MPSPPTSSGGPDVPARAPGKPIPALWVLGGALCVWSFGFSCLPGSDLWWHVAAGRYIVELGSPFLRDPWSFTHAGEPWLHHEWLADVVYHGWVEAFGLASLAVWKWLLLVVTYGLLQWRLARETGEWLAATAATLFAVALAAPFLDVRPHLYSLLGTVLVICLAWNRRAPSPWLPLVFLVWANLHGGFFFGLLALGILLAPEALLGGRRAFARALGLGLACAGAAALNPHHVEVFAYPLKYAFDTGSPFRTIAEWISPFRPGGLHSPLYWPWAVGGAVAAAGWSLARARRKDGDLPWSTLGLAGLTLAMSLTSRRFIPLFGIGLSLLLAPVLADLWRRLPGRERIPDLAPPIAVLGLGLFWLVPYPLQPARAFHYLAYEDAFPVETVRFIQANRLSGRVFAYYNWGGYLHLHTDGAMKVFIDGRADTVYDAETWNRYDRVLNGREGWIEVVESSGADYFLWPIRGEAARRNLQARLLATGRWRALYGDAMGVLLVREGVRVPHPLQETAESPWRDHARSVARLARRDLPGAIAHAERALERMPHHRSACQMLVELHARSRDMERARSQLRACEAQFPDALGLARLRERLEGGG